MACNIGSHPESVPWIQHVQIGALHDGTVDRGTGTDGARGVQDPGSTNGWYTISTWDTGTQIYGTGWYTISASTSCPGYRWCTGWHIITDMTTDNTGGRDLQVDWHRGYQMVHTTDLTCRIQHRQTDPGILQIVHHIGTPG